VEGKGNREEREEGTWKRKGGVEKVGERMKRKGREGERGPRFIFLVSSLSIAGTC